MNLTNMVRVVRTTVVKHSPEILTAMGIAGMLSTTVLAVRATPKALALIEERKEMEEVDRLDKIETVKTVWKCYIPSAVIGVTSIFCIIGASSVNLRRNAALATAYALSESTLREYKDKVLEEVGEKKEQKIRDSIAKDRIDRNPVSKNEVVVTKRGETLCYDRYSGRYFMSDIETLKKAANDLNRQMRDDMYISLNELYNEIGMSDTKLGDELGWNIDRGYIDLDLSAQIADDGRPCIVVDYHIEPRYEYHR